LLGNNGDFAGVKEDREMSQKQRSAENGCKRAIDAFKQCPACESRNVFDFESEVFCCHCDWNSIEASVNARFDALYGKALTRESFSVESASALSLEVAS
jgi:hypothetical protein